MFRSPQLNTQRFKRLCPVNIPITCLNYFLLSGIYSPGLFLPEVSLWTPSTYFCPGVYFSIPDGLSVHPVHHNLWQLFPGCHRLVEALLLDV